MRATQGWRLRLGALIGRMPTLQEIAWSDRPSVRAAMRQLAQTAPVANGEVLCRVLGRYKMLLDGRDISLTPHLALDGCWEMPLTRALLRMLLPGMRVADVGANVGYFTVLMGAAVERSGRVLAFEPNPRVAERLRRTVIINGFGPRVEVRAEALGEIEGGEATLHFDPTQLGGAALDDEEAHPGLERARVVTRRLDQTPGASELELVKIDAEGSEAAIWRGMSGMLARPTLRTVVLEWEPLGHPDPRAALARFAQAGFRAHAIDAWGGLSPVDEATLLATVPGSATMIVLRR